MLVLINEQGRVLQWTNNTAEELEGWLPPGVVAVERDTQPDPDTDYFDVVAGVWAKKPAQPTSLHTWDWQTRTWASPDAAALADDLEAFKTSAKALLNTQRLERDAAPVDVLGVLLDADSTSRANIEGALQLISISGALPAGWVGWKDFNNNFCLADATAGEVQAFLNAAVVAIGNRTQTLYSAVWAAKVLIAAASSKSQVTEAVESAWSAL